MPRPRNQQITKSLLYHVYNRGNGRFEIFHSPADYQRFISILGKYSQERGFVIYHWVLMSNHFHLLMEIGDPRKLSSVMSGIGRAYCHYHHRVYASAGYLFQGRFKCKPIEKESYLLTCGLYIERNPVRAQMVKRAEDYQYSSARYYALGFEDGLTRPDFNYDSFGATAEEKMLNYKNTLSQSNWEDAAEVLSFKQPLGSEEFKSKLIKEKGKFVLRRGRPRKVRSLFVNR